MTNPLNNTADGHPAAVSFTELKRIVGRREVQWVKVMRDLVETNGMYEDEILRLQQHLGIPLSLPSLEKRNG